MPVINAEAGLWMLVIAFGSIYVVTVILEWMIAFRNRLRVRRIMSGAYGSRVRQIMRGEVSDG